MDENGQDSAYDQGAIRILIADDRPQVRESLQALLETEDGLLVIGHARDGHEAVTQCATLAPGVALMDLEMPGLDGLAATRLLRGRAHCPAIVISTKEPGTCASEHVPGSTKWLTRLARRGVDAAAGCYLR